MEPRLTRITCAHSRKNGKTLMSTYDLLHDDSIVERPEVVPGNFDLAQTVVTQTKFFATTLNSRAGTSGGVFEPPLYLGSMMGAAYDQVCITFSQLNRKEPKGSGFSYPGNGGKVCFG